MLDLFLMWALVEALGFVFLPLTITVFHNLPDRGWAFNKAIGVAVLAFFVWLPLMVFHVLPFSRLFIAGVLLILVALNVVGFIRVRQTIVKLIRVNLPYIVATEVVFGGMILLLGWIRSYGPDIRSFEMFMDEGFLASIMRSPHFPPNDMWYSGYPINYYYYAHYTIAMLAKLLGQPPSIAFNTGICMLFGLTAVSLFGVTCNIVAWGRHLRKKNTADTVSTGEVEQSSTIFPPLWRAVPYGVLTMGMALLMGNLAGTQEWFQTNTDLSQFNWFNPSRVVTNTINEFPAFSFLLSCFHAHVLTLAFTIVAIALAFNLFLGSEGKGIVCFWARLAFAFNPIYYCAGYWWTVYNERVGLSNVYDACRDVYRCSTMVRLRRAFSLGVFAGHLHRQCRADRTLIYPVRAVLSHLHFTFTGNWRC